LVVGAIVVAGLVAIGLSGRGAPTGANGGTSSKPPTLAPASGSASGSATASGEPVITGASLPDFENPTGDPAVGQPAPEVGGTDFKGNEVAIANDGHPKVVLFIAHWCPHCQREVPLIQDWVDAGGVPAGVELISVATAIDPNRPNYPPDQWLEREGWTSPVIADTTNSVADAYGLTVFPYFVFVGADGTVKARAVGELPIAQLQTFVDALGAG
jgi:thiol-disulfide isomerase/thioredoxin